ncbi:creatininase family protein [Modestobacter sp. I12A-02628]|uniref:Creatininase family protein n=1 Tax=Goekera deserti TaxID=2497753 RepID=A0A7K3WBK1_9ACTN|nr:creatininase family protein [Goekera deserti]MPQ97393.1 creatininase family protein [Goekera deserti]NDI48006.1 creatininase family protein [Goekera deserti]NEL53754.1 creatininase family protein [Goekera deserti]
MTTERRWERLTGPEVGAIDTTAAVAVVPIGAVEQHGPHLPLMTDCFIAEQVATRAVAALPDDAPVWLLPTQSIGKSTEHLGWPGTLTWSTETLLAMCRDLGRSVAASGFRRLVFVNGHGGNPSLLDTVARDVRVATGLMVFPISVFRLGLPAGLDLVGADFDVHGGHSETSVMLALAPDTVHMDRAVEGGRAVADLFAGPGLLTLEGAVPTAWVTDDVSSNGVVGDPRRASAAVGEQIVAWWTARLAAALLEVSAFEFPVLRRDPTGVSHPARGV